MLTHLPTRLLIENKNLISIATVIVHMESVSSCCQDNQPTMNPQLNDVELFIYPQTSLDNIQN